ncbi:hypothetical protein GP486_003394 [Trichoglossum hirsutum]|uniref:DUF1746 domain-containing protein n=1 Tax=Trichoglossum hirsutum TaxID=265104 RepID=A0A9P8LD54_9PEZI|nr:hypothetical protein GP486_003394 [Trichoglossum hirsutum]
MNDESSASSGGPHEDVYGDRQAQQRIATFLRTKRRRDAVDHILRNLDILIYCHLSVLYYMDVSIFRFILRAAIQLNFLTPKPPIFPEMPKHRPYVGAIFGSNILCCLLHLLYARPEAGEATRGYLHGGMIIDFVGQKGPISKLRLLTLDLVVLTLQLVMLSVHIKRQTLRSASSTVGRSTPDAEVTAPSIQDHDLEERGLRRSGPDGVELQTFPPTHDNLAAQGRTGGDEDGERDELLVEQPEALDQGDSGPEPLTEFHHGELIAAEIHILDTIRSQWRDYENSRSTTSGGSPTGAMAAALPSRRFGVRVRIGQTEIRGP